MPWRCHCSLIADALPVRGVQVEHITSATRRDRHALTPWARVEGQRITYPPESLPPRLRIQWIGGATVNMRPRVVIVGAGFPAWLGLHIVNSKGR
jgi:hypothetical protein